MNNSLSKYEMNLVTNAEVLLVKNKIIKQVIEQFANLAEEYKDMLKVYPPSIDNIIDPKISRGENYNGLAYVMLDYPRQFERNDIFAIRSFFWWGNFFSITLQLSGKYHQKYCFKTEKAIQLNLLEGWYIGCANDPWQHHFEKDNYSPVLQHKNYHIGNKAFLKIAKKIPLSQWDEANIFFKSNYKSLLQILND